MYEKILMLKKKTCKYLSPDWWIEKESQAQAKIVAKQFPRDDDKKALLHTAAYSERGRFHVNNERLYECNQMQIAGCQQSS